jgi:hypothetical protein
MIAASLQAYLPLGELARIVAVCLGVSLIAPVAASLVITGLAAQASSRRQGEGSLAGDLRIALGVTVLVALIATGIYALAFP